jgi:hypothetical protein
LGAFGEGEGDGIEEECFTAAEIEAEAEGEFGVGGADDRLAEAGGDGFAVAADAEVFKDAFDDFAVVFA